MEDDISQHTEKPTTYLDQNIFDLFVDGEYQEFSEKLKSNFLIVYSDETLKKIKRSGDYSNKYFLDS